MSPRNIPWSEAFFRGYRLKIVMGSRFLRNLVGSKAAQDCCLGGKVEGWKDSVATLAGLEHRLP